MVRIASYRGKQIVKEIRIVKQYGFLFSNLNDFSKISIIAEPLQGAIIIKRGMRHEIK